MTSGKCQALAIQVTVLGRGFESLMMYYSVASHNYINGSINVFTVWSNWRPCQARKFAMCGFTEDGLDRSCEPLLREEVTCQTGNDYELIPMNI
jgi:hypothetical protein